MTGMKMKKFLWEKSCRCHSDFALQGENCNVVGGQQIQHAAYSAKSYIYNILRIVSRSCSSWFMTVVMFVSIKWTNEGFTLFGNFLDLRQLAVNLICQQKFSQVEEERKIDEFFNATHKNLSSLRICSHENVVIHISIHIWVEKLHELIKNLNSLNSLEGSFTAIAS